ncbi:Uncharacterised protein [Vibrio cholerae]|nr:Uncharacterised protein [Vibrio cholerae]CSC64438.1 Uncharacterised protein [Vibrio cholerae]
MTFGSASGAVTKARGIKSVSNSVQYSPISGKVTVSPAAKPSNLSVGSSLCRSPVTRVILNWSFPTSRIKRILWK